MGQPTALGRTARRCSLIAILLAGAIAHGQATQTPPTDPLREQLAEIGPSLRLTAQDTARQDAAGLTRAQKEAQVRAIRRQHFGHITSRLQRQEGQAKLSDIAEPALFPLMLDVFKRDDRDAKQTLLRVFEDHAVRTKTSEGDAAIAWMAIYDESPRVREDALAALRRRYDAWNLPLSAKSDAESTTAPPTSRPQVATPRPVQLVAFAALASRSPRIVARGGDIVDALTIVEALPWMIAGQVSSRPSGPPERTGALAYIVVGTQTNFVSDLEPVVAGNAVAFDPEISTLTSGTYIRVLDAAVVTYNVELHRSLHRLGSRLSGRDLNELGWNSPAWQEWYTSEFLPAWTARNTPEQPQTQDLETPKPESAHGTP